MSDRVFQPESGVADYFLGEWQLSLRSNSLQRAGTRIELENRLALLLVFLIENKGEVLSKERILKTVWPGKVVNEDSLAVAISHLRKALGDNPRAPNYIKTIPGVGYQLIADAGVVNNVISSPSPESRTSVHTQIQKVPYGSEGKWFVLSSAKLALVGLSFVTAVFIAIYFWFANQSDVPPLNEKPIARASEQATALSPAGAAIWDSIPRPLTGAEPDLKAAIGKLRELLQMHPGFAPAYAVMADAKMKLLQDDLFAKNHCAEVIGLLDKSLALDATQAPVLVSRGNLMFWCRGDYAAAEESYRRAALLDPANDSAPLQYAQLLLARGAFAESLAQVEASRRINPLNYSVPTVVWIYQMQARDDLALEELSRIDTSEPGDRYFHISAQRVYARLGRELEAMTHWEWLMRDAGYSEPDITAAYAAFSAGGLGAVNRWLLARKDAVDLGQYTPPLSWARYAIMAGDIEAALDYLEQAAQRRQSPLWWGNVDPAYDPVREHPRFRRVMENFALR